MKMDAGGAMPIVVSADATRWISRATQTINRSPGGGQDYAVM
jgi:hypothetical protein